MMVHDELLEHYKFPRHRGIVAHPDFSIALYNQSCGDRVCVTGRIEQGCLIDCAFQGEGCVLSQAAASILMEYAHGKLVSEVRAITAECMQAMVGVQVGPTRLRCLLLVLDALQKATGEVR